MYGNTSDLLDALRSAPAVFEALLYGSTQEQLATARGGDEGWLVVEVLCHLRDAEERALERMRAMRDAVNPHIPAYNQDLWAQERNYAGANVREALAAFLSFRAQHIAELATLSMQQWERTGQHEEQGQVTIYAQTLHIVAHDLMHAAQIARQLHKATL